jgi:deoxyribonuclease V
MIACVDVHYREDWAVAACATFREWEDATPADEYVLRIENVAPYVSGQFFRRELPSLLKILAQVSPQPDIVVIDGYVWLDTNRKKGLGGYLYEALGETVCVIGVAKTSMRTATHAVEVLRGNSGRALFITSAGMDPAAAANCVRRMHGRYRIPTLLKHVDRLSRSAVP